MVFTDTAKFSSLDISFLSVAGSLNSRTELTLSVNSSAVDKLTDCELGPKTGVFWKEIRLPMKVDTLTVSEKRRVTMLVVKSRSNDVSRGLTRSDTNSLADKASSVGIGELPIPAKSLNTPAVADKKVDSSDTANSVSALIALESSTESSTIKTVSVIDTIVLLVSVTLMVESFFSLWSVNPIMSIVEMFTGSLNVRNMSSAVRSRLNLRRLGGRKSAVMFKAITASVGEISSISLLNMSLTPSNGRVMNVVIGP